MDWDDLRYFYLIAREGSIRAAANVLGVNHSTVSRRLQGFEAGLGVRLFDRGPTGYTLTPAGSDMLNEAGDIAGRMDELERRVKGRDSRLCGTVRVAVPDFLMALIAPMFAEFCDQYPGIIVDWTVGMAHVNLTRREAEIAVRVTGSPPESLVGRKLCHAAAAIYGSGPYCMNHSDQDLEDLDWIGWDRQWSDLPPVRWMQETIPRARIKCRVDSPGAMLESIRSGLGVGILACLIGDTDNGLRRVTDTPLPGVGQDLWLLTHADLRATARIRVLLDFLFERIKSRRPLIEGEAGRSVSPSMTMSAPDGTSHGEK